MSGEKEKTGLNIWFAGTAESKPMNCWTFGICEGNTEKRNVFCWLRGRVASCMVLTIRNLPLSSVSTARSPVPGLEKLEKTLKDGGILVGYSFLICSKLFSILKCKN